MITNRNSPLQLHLGCGKRYLPGFVHIDLDEFPHIDYRASIEALPMFADDSVDLIYVSHAFGYFDRTQAKHVLREWLRVLKVGGILRLAVPDFAALAKVYLERGDLNAIVGPLFGRITIRGIEGPKVLYHRTVYDESTITALCLEAGFRFARRYDWRQTIHRDFDDFSQAYHPHMDKERGLLISLNLEATK